jgi:hypothetical protein
MSAVIFTIQKKVIPMVVSLQTPLLINSLTIGSALCAVLPKICLKKFSEFLNPGI